VHLQVPRQATLVAGIVFVVRTEEALPPSVHQQQVPVRFDDFKLARKLQCLHS
jgi:hypothetical protein